LRVVTFSFRLVRVDILAVTRFEVTRFAEFILAVRTPRVVTFPVAVLLLLILEFVLVKLTTPRVVTFPVAVLLV
jgi:hypothetical protein